MNTCTLEGCVSDHREYRDLHHTANRTVLDIYEHPINVELLYNSTTGQATLAIGGYELSLLGALDLTATVRSLVDAGIVLPGAIGAESARAAS